jgi:hypothetical protein
MSTGRVYSEDPRWGIRILSLSQEQERSAQGQKAMANDLRTLLQAKLRLASGSATWAGVNGSFANAFKSVEVVDKVREALGDWG